MQCTQDSLSKFDFVCEEKVICCSLSPLNSPTDSVVFVSSGCDARSQLSQYHLSRKWFHVDVCSGDCASVKLHLHVVHNALGSEASSWQRSVSTVAYRASMHPRVVHSRTHACSESSRFEIASFSFLDGDCNSFSGWDFEFPTPLPSQ